MVYAPIPVEVDAIEARFRLLSDAEKITAQALLEDAWSVVQATVPDVQVRINARTLPREIAAFVVSAMVLRVLRNPNGVRSWSVDDYSETRDSSVAAGSLYLSDGEIALLTGEAGRPGAFSIKPYSAPVRTGSDYYGAPWLYP